MTPITHSLRSVQSATGLLVFETSSYGTAGRVNNNLAVYVTEQKSVFPFVIIQLLIVL